MNAFFVLTNFLAFSLLVTAADYNEASSDELLTKAQLRQQAENIVNEVNSAHNSWRATVHPRFAEMNLSEIRRMMGVKRRPMQVQRSQQEGRPNQFEMFEMSNNSTDLPKHFDARENWPECADVISQIEDQSSCGSCWAVSTASTMTDRLCIHSNGRDKIPISAADLMSCETTSGGCAGGYPDAAWKWFHDHGVVTGTNYTLAGGCKPYTCEPGAWSCETPECELQCQEGYNVTYEADKRYAISYTNWENADPVDIMTEIINNGPVETDYKVYFDFIFYQSGVYEHNITSFIVGYHAVRIIGWGEEDLGDGQPPVPYWLIANSWSTDWGMNGTFKIVRGKDDCGIESMGINFGMPGLDHLKKEENEFQ